MHQFETERLQLNVWNAHDAEFLFQLSHDPDVIRFTDDKPFDSLAEAARFIETYDHHKKFGYGRWLIRLKHNDEPIGWCGLKNQMHELEIIDIGFRLAKKHRSKGYATEAAQATLMQGFEKFQMETITGRVAIGNNASQGVLKKLDMHYWKHEACHHHPAIWYAITREEWLEKRP